MFRGWRYLTMFDFFFLANALFLPAVSGVFVTASRVEKEHAFTVTQTAGENLPPRL